MKRNQVNELFDKDLARKRNIIINVIVISIIFVLSLFTLVVYINKRQVQYVKYNENSHVNYKVYLKDNSFYKDNIIDANNQYISELIDHVNAEFRHSIALEKSDLKYAYSYRIEASALVNDKITHKNLYEFDEELVSKKNITSNNANSTISENINIDYVKYNELISKFVQTYSLSETENVLKVKLIVSMVGSCDESETGSVSDSITTLEIPLTQRTLSMDVTSNLVDDDDNVMLCIKPSPMNIVYIFVSVITFALGVILLVKLIVYIAKTRSAQTVYDKELKKILSNYRSYIQKVNSRFNFSDYQTLKVDNFTDMLEIRDTTNQPILMIENGDKNSVYFVIPTTTKILYIYSIRVSDIEKEMNDKEK